MSEKSQKSLLKKSAMGNTNHCSRGRRWCMTINNYTNKKYLEIFTIMRNKKWKHIIGKEIGGINGTPHLQIYFESTHQVRFNAIKKLFPTAHIERANGNKKENIKYCAKDDNYVTNFDMNIIRVETETQILNNILEKMYKEPVPEGFPHFLPDYNDDNINF